MRLIIQFIRKEYKKYLIIAGLLLTVDLSQVVIPIFTKGALDAISAGSQSLVIRNGVYILLVAILIIIMRYVYQYLLRSLTLSLDYDIKTALYNKYLQLSKNYLSQAEIGDLMARVTNDTSAVRSFMIMGLLGITDIFFLGVTTFISMVSMNARLALIVISPLLLLIPLTLNFGTKVHVYFKKVQDLFGEMTVRIREAISGIRVIKAFVREDFYLGLFASVNEKYIKENLKLVKLDGFFDPTISLLVNIATLNLIIFGGIFAVRNTVDIGTVGAFFQYIQTLVWPMLAVGFSVSLFQRARASVDRIQEILSLEIEIKDENPVNISTLNGQITISNLSFTYEQNGSKILDEVSLNIPQGTLTGITGPPGSGKTTLLNLILRIYDPPEGTVKIDKIDVRKIPLSVIKNQIAYVPQEPFLFSDSILNNIKFARPDATDEEIIEATKIADIYKDILSFPEGFETIVGEQGITLSGGERQRVSIARAIITKRPIMIFDDSLSAVDIETERNIIRNLKEVLSKYHITTLIVSQRVSALSVLDRVIVMVNGKVIEDGSPDSLIKKKGYYSHLYRKQLLEGIET